LQVVPALLDDRRRQPEPSEQLSGLAVPLLCDLERALSVACGRVDAERDNETLHAALAGPGDEAVDGVQPPPVAGPRRKRQVLGAQTVRESEEVRKPAGPRVDVD